MTSKKFPGKINSTLCFLFTPDNAKKCSGSKTTKSTFNPAFLVDSEGNYLNIKEKHKNPQPIDYTRVTAAFIKKLPRPTIPEPTNAKIKEATDSNKK